MTKRTNGGWADSKTTWAKHAGPHNLTLASGQKVTARVFGIGELLVRNAIPEGLRDTVALQLLNRDKGGIGAVIGADLLELNRNGTDPAASEAFQQRLRDAREMTKLLVAEALVSPRMTVEELDDPALVPWEDVEELMRIVTGQQPFDSRGVRVGVERIDAWATFQHEHADGPCLGEGCPRCQRALEALSSHDLVSV